MGLCKRPTEVRTCQLKDVLVNVKIIDKTKDQGYIRDLTQRIFVQDKSNMQTETQPVFKSCDTSP